MARCAVIFIHGLAKKPAPDVLERLWVDALNRDDPKPEVFGYDNPGLGIHTAATIRSVYWADVFYGEDYETDLSGYERRIESDALEAAEGETLEELAGVALPQPKTPQERAFIEGLSARYQLESALDDRYLAPAAPGGRLEQYQLERFPLPLGVKKGIIRRFASEAYYYLFDQPFTTPAKETLKVRSVLRARLNGAIKALKADHDRVVVASHSMGTIIAYDCLKNCAECEPIDGLITLGSPLGVDEIQDNLIPGRDRANAFPGEKLKGPWINVFDPLDPVAALDPRLANDYRRGGAAVVRDIEEPNWGKWRHTISKYLKGPQMRKGLREMLGV
jgi:pimeloyl-ACP methyl ester carboxylesterase